MQAELGEGGRLPSLLGKVGREVHSFRASWSCPRLAMVSPSASRGELPPQRDRVIDPHEQGGVPGLHVAGAGRERRLQHRQRGRARREGLQSADAAPPPPRGAPARGGRDTGPRRGGRRRVRRERRIQHGQPTRVRGWPRVSADREQREAAWAACRSAPPRRRWRRPRPQGGARRRAGGTARRGGRPAGTRSASLDPQGRAIGSHRHGRGPEAEPRRRGSAPLPAARPRPRARRLAPASPSRASVRAWSRWFPAAPAPATGASWRSRWTRSGSAASSASRAAGAPQAAAASASGASTPSEGPKETATETAGSSAGRAIQMPTAPTDTPTAMAATRGQRRPRGPTGVGARRAGRRRSRRGVGRVRRRRDRLRARRRWRRRSPRRPRPPTPEASRSCATRAGAPRGPPSRGPTAQARWSAGCGALRATRARASRRRHGPRAGEAVLRVRLHPRPDDLGDRRVEIGQQVLPRGGLVQVDGVAVGQQHEQRGRQEQVGAGRAPLPVHPLLGRHEGGRTQDGPAAGEPRADVEHPRDAEVRELCTLRPAGCCRA